MKKRIILIPARLESTRLPRKLLLDLGGRSILQHTYMRCKKARGFDGVWICTDSDEIAEHALSFGAQVLRTDSTPNNGTERIAQACAQIPDAEIIVNVQGDEAFVDPMCLEELAETICPVRCPVATVAVAADPSEITNPNCVKVVCDLGMNALLLSRAAIPYARNQDMPFLPSLHLGVYAFDREFLLDYSRWDSTPLEQLEMIEILRVLERGHSLRIMDWDRPEGPSIDTEEDYQAALMALNCCGR